MSLHGRVVKIALGTVLGGVALLAAGSPAMAASARRLWRKMLAATSGRAGIPVKAKASQRRACW